jgi:peptidylprolyl isomerase
MGADMARWGPPGREGVGVLVTALILLLVALISFGAYQAFFTPQLGGTPVLRILEGDRVRIDYIGTYEDGRVFDTSREAVARDNATYPKAPSFRWRATWEPFAFTVGAGEAIQGFDRGVLGLREGDSRTLVVPPELGYGVRDPSLVESRVLEATVPVWEALTFAGFEARFGETARDGAVYREPAWGWEVTAFVETGAVSIRREARAGDTVRPFGSWDARVLDVDDAANGGAGRITVLHLLGPEDVDRAQGTDERGTFYVSAVDRQAGTFTVDYNPFNAGRTLIFQITVAEITRP